MCITPLIGLFQACAKLHAFEYLINESRESNAHTKRSNWSSFKGTP